MSDLQIGKFIAFLRKEKGMTQRELAEQLNLSDKAVSKWERGESYPEITLLPTLAEILGVSADELLAGERREHAEVQNSYDFTEGERERVEERTPALQEEMKQPSSHTGRRICSYLIDTLLCVLLLCLIAFISEQFSPDYVSYADGGAEVYTGLLGNRSLNGLFQFVNTWILSIMGASGFISWLFLWLTNGYTPEKWLMGLRVVKRDGGRINIGTAIFRDIIVKGMAGLFSMNIFTIISFIFMIAGKEKQSLHDMAAHTDVVYVGYRKRLKQNNNR